LQFQKTACATPFSLSEKMFFNVMRNIFQWLEKYLFELLPAVFFLKHNLNISLAHQEQSQHSIPVGPSSKYGITSTLLRTSESLPDCLRDNRGHSREFLWNEIKICFRDPRKPFLPPLPPLNVISFFVPDICFF